MRNDEFHLRFGGDILPTILHALLIARNSTLGVEGGKPVMKELQGYYDQLSRDCGVPELHRAVDEYKWFAACQAIMKAQSYHWYVEGSGTRPDDDVSLIVDGRQYKLDYRLPLSTPNLAGIQAFLERHAHVAAAKGETVAHWRPYRPPEPPTADAEATGPRP